MLEAERSSDEALREPTYRRLYLGALAIENPERQLKACYIILLAGRIGLRTGEIQHVREEWIDWDRGEIAIPQHDPCACMNCWIRAKQKASDEDETIRDEIVELFEKRLPDDSERDAEEVVEEMLRDDEELPEEVSDDGADDDSADDDSADDNRTAEEILYEERWQPKYPRSARRVPFGHSRRLTAVVSEFMRTYGHLEITQVSMNNLVEEAAEHADGVDPENITIRGLRATAATHYATFIRNPKALQDLLGWTRIETATRYLRRSGAFTTDVVYHAFDQGELSPAMFPGEPTQRYPIIDNPLPYQQEPYDPMLYDKPTRHEIGRSLAEDSLRRLIHPRAQNSPDTLDYDPTAHQILTHEDYADDIIERDGITIFEAPTITEFYEDHDRITPADVESDDSKRRYESEIEWEAKNLKQTELSDITGEQDEYRSNFGKLFVATIGLYFKRVEQVGEFISKRVPTPGIQQSKTGRVIVSIGGWLLILLSVSFIFYQIGYLDLQTMSLDLRPPIILALGIALYTAYKLPKTETTSEVFEYN